MMMMTMLHPITTLNHVQSLVNKLILSFLSSLSLSLKDNWFSIPAQIFLNFQNFIKCQPSPQQLQVSYFFTCLSSRSSSFSFCAAQFFVSWRIEKSSYGVRSTFDFFLPPSLPPSLFPWSAFSTNLSLTLSEEVRVGRSTREDEWR